MQTSEIPNSSKVGLNQIGRDQDLQFRAGGSELEEFTQTPSLREFL